MEGFIDLVQMQQLSAPSDSLRLLTNKSNALIGFTAPQPISQFSYSLQKRENNKTV